MPKCFSKRDFVGKMLQGFYPGNYVGEDFGRYGLFNLAVFIELSGDGVLEEVIQSVIGFDCVWLAIGQGADFRKIGRILHLMVFGAVQCQDRHFRLCKAIVCV